MRQLVRAALFIVVLLVTSHAAGQPNEAAARALFDEGRSLMDQEKYEEACAKFEGSQRLGAKASTALNLGICYDKRAMFASAWSTFGTAATLAKREEHAEREQFAREQMAAMEKKLARLTIEIGTSIEGLQVTLDGKPVIPAMFGTALPIDPGTHALAATAPGKKPWSKEVVIPAEKAEISETVPMLEDSAVTPPPPTPTPPPPLPTPPPAVPAPAPEQEPLRSISPLVYVGFSVGGVGILVGAITGVVAIANTSTIRDNCEGDRCPLSEEEAIEDAEVVANISNALFAVGGAGVIVGIIGLFVGDDEEPAQAHVEPIVGPGYVGLRGRF